jgi:hypothetical protein
MRIANVFCCVAIAPLLIGAAQPVRLQPSSGWVLDLAENSCRLVRHFGQGRDETVLGFEMEAPGQMDMLVAGQPLSTDRDEVSARFLPVQTDPIKGEVARTSEGSNPAILWTTVQMLPADVIRRNLQKAKERGTHPAVRPPPLDLAEEAADRAAHQDFAAHATELEIAVSARRPVILETGPLGDPIKAIDQCARESLRDWGVDPDLEDKIVRPVWAPNPAAWFTPDDYPKGMLTEGQQSVVKVRLLVDATGRVTHCTSLSHFKPPEFGQVVCDKFMSRAHFEPAELADGTKVPSYYVNRIVFRMEE